jgi:pullulanase/glycogen debranching enzyme
MNRGDVLAVCWLQANGEGNNDGCNDNFSWNCGHEGNTSVSATLVKQYMGSACNIEVRAMSPPVIF